ncbi:Hpt domain-containing protein [Cellvibrio japonicus]|nr:Hpt domain-containing protein [Cellvibrio japonicus]QEI10829.1 response regulator [Cellvibrio japonicus]QEI14405.1 response regulator [Cellvibrio japonicus]QEI17983.1 response regulator [Cellvibrio japonicus]
MADNRNFAALDWLIHEIGETLKEARQSLENYVENPNDAARIRFCLTHIHQVHGSLQMVEFYGAAMLASEMEQLTQAMIAGKVANSTEAQEVLMRAILQFPLYLDQVKATRKDNPLVVLPLLNDLRAVRGESLLTDTKLFVPNLAPARKVSGARLPVTNDNVQFQAMVLKLRQMYQYAASGFIRDINPEENLAYLHKAFARLQKLTHGTARFALWDICLALVEALEIDALEISVAVKNLLRQLDKEIKILAVHGIKALNSFTNDELIKNLLYYVARAGKHAPGFAPDSNLQRIYDTYNLEQALLEGKEAGDDAQNMISAPDADAMRSVVGALKDELGIIKEALDVCLNGGDAQQALGSALPIVKRVADTLAVLGLGDLRKHILEQGAALELVADARSELSQDQLMAVAGQILALENALDNLLEKGGQAPQETILDADITLARAKDSVLRESRNGLEHAKDAIIEYIASQWNREHLQQVPDILREIRGGLDIVPLPRPARILGACARYIEEKLLQEEATPQWSTLDTLADAITSVEYYLERLSSGARKEENDLLLSVAEESVATLGYAVAKTSRPQAAASTPVDIPEVPAADTVPETPGVGLAPEHSLEMDPATELSSYDEPAVIDDDQATTSLEQDSEQLSALYAQSAVTADHDDNQAASLASAYAQATAPSAGTEPATDGDTWDIATSHDTSLETEEQINEAPVDLADTTGDLADTAGGDAPEESHHQEDEPEEEPTLIRTSNAPVIERDNEDIDDEIIEIFIEEAGEVTETIGEYFPRWAQNFDDKYSLTEFRRAFHTLKGSGRMVGANEIGELAWSIENMLNRVIDHTIEPGQIHVNLIRGVVALLPDMIDAFRLDQPNPHAAQAESYRQQAHQLAQGLAPTPPAANATVDEPEPIADILLEEVPADEIQPESTADAFAVTDHLELGHLELDDTDTLAPTSDDELDDLSQALAELAEAQAIGEDEELHELAPAETSEDTLLDMELVDGDSLDEPSSAEDIVLENLPGLEVIEETAIDTDSQEQQLRASYANLELDSEDDIDDPDAQLWDIFGTEALYHLQVVQQFIAHMEAEAPIYEPPSEAMQRALHTLKGSAHMAEITQVAELATPLERFVKELRSYQVNINDDILQLLRDAVSYTQVALDQIKAGEEVNIPRLQQFVARVNELREIHVAPLVRQQELDEHGKRPIDPELLAIFMAEEMNLLLDADQIIAHWRTAPEDTRQLVPVMEELRKLTQAAAHAYLPVMAELGEKLQSVYEAILAQQLSCDHSLCNALNHAHTALLDMVDAIAAGQNLQAIPEAVNAELDELLSNEVVTLAALTQDAFHIEELVDEPYSGDETIAALESPDLPDDGFPAQEASISAAGDGDDFSAIPELESEFILDEDIEPVALDFFVDDDLASSPEASETRFDDILLEDIAPIDEVALPVTSLDQPWVEEAPEAAVPETIAPEVSIPEAVVEEVIEPATVEAEPENIAAYSAVAELDEDFDPEIVEIFIDEAGELLEDIDRALQDWQDDWNNSDSVEELKRCLHTFKGGARLAGLVDLGDQSHDFETMLIDMDRNTELDQAFFRRVNGYQDQLHAGVEQVRARLNGEAIPSQAPAVTPVSSYPVSEQPMGDQDLTLEDIPTLSADDVEELEDEPTTFERPGYSKPTIVVDNTREQPSDDAQELSSDKPNVLTFAPKAKPAPTNLPKVPGSEFGGLRGTGAQSQHLAARRSGPQEVVKVSAELLEELVNLAGETSISRGRMEQQVSDLSHAIDEMDSTIERLQEQLRRLDIETEAQILFRQEQMAQHEEFDPLEMDRYSQLQQLSRSLIESASDLMDLKYTLADKTRDTETLLLQQSRINTDLQEGLMRSRMVPFSRLVPRLRRIVRQAATELNKEVDFDLDNVEGELDRTVLERMVAPLEHMLRNAVDHGIELPDERTAAGKSANGRILLSLGREGGDVIIRLIDDGRGINLKRVREKAIERGLMSPDAQLSDQDVIQFILHAGFSTAEKVTQISGRGVGMDVVHSEIKQLGGAMFIDSEWGQGTEFTIRLPFTVSVNRALMIQIGDDLYAIPLNTIEGIVRVSPFELEHYYQEPDARFEYASEEYLVRYLGTMLDSSAQPKLDGQSLPLPVVLVRSAENTVALQVDRLLGSREIVVKTLGAQFSAVRGVSGATVMGDGSVVVILDLHALIREQLALGSHQAVLLEAPSILSLPEEDTSEKTVMVVDDSVTVRKVTGRFLEREGFRVLTAKDGAEAIQLLQDHMPDVMLLDIEMPRMDGFEVAKTIRGSSRLKHLPIIMITSRTGEKHREHAFSLGVNKYMGKPYQEDLLLENIRELLKHAVK